MVYIPYVVPEIEMEVDTNLTSRATSKIELSHAKFWQKLGVTTNFRLTKRNANELLKQARASKENISENYLYSLFNSLRKFLGVPEDLKPHTFNLRTVRRNPNTEASLVVGKLNLLKYFCTYIRRFDDELLKLFAHFRLDSAKNSSSTFSLPDGFAKYDIDTGIAVISILCLNVSPRMLSKLHYYDLALVKVEENGFLVYKPIFGGGQIKRSRLELNEPFFSEFSEFIKKAIEVRYILYGEDLEDFRKNFYSNSAQLSNSFKDLSLIECKLDTINKNIRSKYVYVNKVDTKQSLGLRCFRKSMNQLSLEEIS